ncbi:MAG: HypC/HybG/HupF family hydrogenase formation chaperone [Parvibaculum sp.]
MCLAIPGKVLSVTEAGPLARVGLVDFGGLQREINLTCVPEAQVGDYVLTHVGLAISVIDEDEAQRVFTYLDEIGELSVGGGSR